MSEASSLPLIEALGERPIDHELHRQFGTKKIAETASFSFARHPLLTQQSRLHEHRLDRLCLKIRRIARSIHAR